MIAEDFRGVSPFGRTGLPGRIGGYARGFATALLRPLSRMLRSMLGQMAFVTILFLACGVYLLAVKPILSMPPLGTPDPIAATRALVIQRLSVAMVGADRDPGTIAALARDPTIRDIARGNPDFVYFVRRGDVSGGTTRPHYDGIVGLDRLDALLAAMRAAQPVRSGGPVAVPDPSLCVQLERRPRDARGEGYFSYGNCGIPSYMEFHGLRRPIALPVPSAFEARMHWLWSYSRGFLIPALGLFALLAAILAINIVRIRRVARLTRTLRLEGPRSRLPQDGLPSEMLPLVQAMNQMIAQADEDQRRRRFFLSAAAHEMRTPLTVLRTRLESLPDDAVKATLVRDLSQVTRLSNDLLTLMGIDRRRSPFEPVDLTDACLDVIADLDPVAQARGVGFRLDAPQGAPPVMGDRALIRVAIANLVDNAISFAPPDSDVVITLDGAGQVAVRDVGPGLQVADPAALFEPFVRASGNRPGHGLGLAIVKAVADLHDARATAGDAPGGGALFQLIFPRAGDAARPTEVRHSP